jgi:pyruvate ferredoxin oxidoreductase beta subunit
MAVATNVFPLYEVIDGKWILSRKNPKPKPVKDYLKMQRRFAHLTEEEIEKIQARVDAEWEALLERCGEKKESAPESAEPSGE